MEIVNKPRRWRYNPLKREIVKMKEVAKFLVMTDDFRLLAYWCGKYSLYFEDMELLVDNNQDYYRPTILTVRYYNEDDLQLFIDMMEKNMFIKRIFKTVRPDDIKKIDGFIGQCAKNLLGLRKGKTIRIDSDNKYLQKKFYDGFVFMNDNAVDKKTKEKINFGCKFDFDEYDVLFTIREYFTKTGVVLVTTMKDLDKGD